MIVFLSYCIFSKRRYRKRLNYNSFACDVQIDAQICIFLVFTDCFQGESVEIDNFWIYEPNQYLVVEMKKPLIKNKNYTLTSEIYAELSDSLAGFYRSNYVDTNGNTV